MANSILKLKVESSEYDQKLANAAKGIRHLADVAHKGAGELTGLEKSEVDYIRSLGDMETKSRTASGQVRELSSTYKELKVIYDQLNEVEKSDEGGKALAASLETLRTRAQEAKTQLDTATQSLNDNGEAGKGTSSVMEMLKDKFTVNIDAVKLFNMGLQAAEAALNVAKDAFFNNEEQLDEWGRVVESSHSLYTGFLNALNTGDISGYLSNINQIAQAARDAYDALDALGTYNAFNQINVERTRTNMTESIADYRGGKGSKDTVKAAGEAYKKELQDRKRLENEAYLAAVKRVAAERGVSAKDLTDALSGTYGHYQDLKNVQPTGVRQTVVGSGMFARTGTETFAQTRQEKLGEALRHLNDTELQSLQALGAQAQRTGNEIAQVDKQLTRVLNGRQTGETGSKPHSRAASSSSSVAAPAGSVAALNAEINDLQKKQSLVTDKSAWKAYADQIREVQLRVKELKGEMGFESLQGMKGMSISDTATDAVKAMQNKLKTQKLDVKIVQPKEKADVKASEILSSISSAVGNMASGIEGLGIEIPKDIKNMLGVLNSITMILTSIETFQKIGTLLGFADGGVVKAASGYTVPGRRFSGDMIPARLNAGELVLNQAQAGIMASALQDRDFSGGMMQPYVDGEKIFLGMNNTSKRMGRGEIVTTSMLKHMGLTS